MNMTERTAYTNIVSSGRMLSVLQGYSFFASLVLFILFTPAAFTQEIPEYDELSIFLEVPRVGGFEISALIRGDELLLSVTELFDFLKIRNVPSPGLDSISGYFIDRNAEYVINRTNNSILYQGKRFYLGNKDLIRTESNLYLKALYFGKIFGLDCIFNFRTLSVTLNTKLDLPLIQEMRREEMRRNLTRLKGEIQADTNIGRTYPFFRFGMADWSAISTEEIGGKSETRLNLTLGSVIAGGEATASVNYNSDDPFTEKQQYYLWRHVNNDFKPLKQIMAGKITTGALSTLYSPVIGAQITNTPTTFRRSFGSYTLSDKSEPGWIVELYVNNVLVDYVKADASGFYTFQVPLVYGNSSIKLKFYSPWGEESTREQNIVIPYNFLPKNTLEYNISAGIVEDTLASKFSRAVFNYGVTRSFTLGAGVEYLSSVSSGPLMPFAGASLRLTNNLLLSGEYTYGVRTKAGLSYRLPSNLQLDLNYTIYNKGQKAINYNYREERKAVLYMPLVIGKVRTFQRLSINQIVLPGLSKYTTGEWLLSGSLMGVNTNLTTNAVYIDGQKPNYYSNLSLAFRFPGRLVIMPQVQYGYSLNKLLSARLRLEKYLMDHAFLNLTLEQNFSNNLKMAELGFRYDFSFAQTGLTVRQSNKSTTLVQYARGSLINDTKNGYIKGDNRPNVGKGGITIKPFLDINGNGVKDTGEPGAYGLNLHANGGRVINNIKDTTIRIIGLQPYTSCFIELDPNSFENIAWRLNVKTLSVVVDPNMLKMIEIPVSVAGEASGNVFLEKDGEKNGLGRIIIGFYTSDKNLVAKTLSEIDGYFGWFGFKPGGYYAMVDTAQIRKLGMTCEPDSIPFTIRAGSEGDYVDGLDFTLRMIRTEPEVVIPEKPVIRKDTVYMVIHEVTEELVTVGEDSYAIQLGAFRRRSNALAYRKKLEAITGRDMTIVVQDGYYKVRIPDIKDRAEVDEIVEILRQNGITQVWIISIKGKQQQRLLVEKQDTLAQINETIIEKGITGEIPSMVIQIGAFRNENYAYELQAKVSALINKPAVVVQQDGWYKVQITGFRTREEMDKMIPSLGLIGLHDIWIPPVRMQEGVVPPTQLKPVVPADTAKQVVEKPVVIEKPEVPVPTISIHVRAFHRRSQAVRAQRRIKAKLNLDSEIIPQWDYYHVVIPGFFTREETYKYYPELAGIGYPNVTLIERK
jgi:hypothetical protein